MMKFFRRYNKALLAVFMVLLMIVFIGGSALESLMSPVMNTLVATSNLGTIGLDDQRKARATTSILSAIGLNWRRPTGEMREPIELVDWILLNREADTLNVSASPEAVQAYLGAAFTQDQLMMLANNLRVRPSHIIDAVRELLSIQVAQRAIASSTIPSEAEIRATAAEILDKVKVNAVVLPAAAFVQADSTFTKEKTEAQWSAFRDAAPGSGLEFGYFVPPRLAVEYIKIDRDVIAEKIGIANLEKKARKYFDENRAANPVFRRPADELAESEAVDPSLVGPIQKKSRFLEWDEARETALAAVRKEAADGAAANLANWLFEYDDERWFDAERGEGTYKKTPSAVTEDGYYNVIMQRMPGTIAFPSALSVKRTDFFSAEEAADVPEIGEARYRPLSGRWQNFADLAFRSEFIVPEIPQEKGTDWADYLAPYQTSRYTLSDNDGNAYVFRVVEARPGHPAESVDEVRDRVLQDLQLLEALEVARARAEGLRSCSPDVSLREAYESDDELASLEADGAGVGLFESPNVSRLDLYEAASGTVRDTKYVGGGIGTVPREVINRWFELEEAWERTEVFELADRAAILVIEWAETSPARDDEFEDQREQIAQRLTSQRQRDAVGDWFDPEQIRARNGFVLSK